MINMVASIVSNSLAPGVALTFLAEDRVRIRTLPISQVNKCLPAANRGVNQISPQFVPQNSMLCDPFLALWNHGSSQGRGNGGDL